MFRIGSLQVCINPLRPTKQSGFIQQVDPVFEVHDDLFLRLVVIEKEHSRLIFGVYDNIGIPVEKSLLLRQAIKALYTTPTEVVLACTHTHFGGDPNDETYFAQLMDQTLDALKTIHQNTVHDLTYAFSSIPFTQIGQSRITGHQADVYLDLFSLYHEETRLITFVIHNCHPTIMSGLTPFFSSEYPGAAMRLLKEALPNEFFLFMQGADGDISTRFARKDQSPSEVLRMGTLLKDQVETLLKQKPVLYPFDFTVTTAVIPLKHRLLDIEALPKNPHPTDREKETIEIGRQVLESIRPNFHKLPLTLELTKIDYGHYTQVFAPNELFSYYIKATPKDSSSLICYAQGYAPYVAGLQPLTLTYELFTDTYSDETKQILFETIRKLTTSN